MEWIGTGFVLTLGGMRLRVRIALEDAPCDSACAAAETLERSPAGSRRIRVHAPRR